MTTPSSSINNLSPDSKLLDAAARVGPNPKESENLQGNRSVSTTFQLLSANIASSKPASEGSILSNLKIEPVGGLDTDKKPSLHQIDFSSGNSLSYEQIQRSVRRTSSLLSGNILSSHEASFRFSELSSLNASVTSEDSAKQKELLRELEKAEDELEQRLTNALNRFSQDPKTQAEAKAIFSRLAYPEKPNLSEYWISVLNESLSLGEGDDQFKLGNLLFVATLKSKEITGVAISTKIKLCLKNCFCNMRDFLARNRLSELIAESPELFLPPLAEKTEWSLEALQKALDEAAPFETDPCSRENGILNHFLASLLPKYNWEAINFLNTQGYFIGNLTTIENFLISCLKSVEEKHTQTTTNQDLEAQICDPKNRLHLLHTKISETSLLISDRLEQLKALEEKTEAERLNLNKEREKIEQNKKLPDYQQKLDNWTARFRSYQSTGPVFLKLVSRRLKNELEELEKNKLLLENQAKPFRENFLEISSKALQSQLKHLTHLSEMQDKKLHEFAKAAGLESLSDQPLSIESKSQVNPVPAYTK